MRSVVLSSDSVQFHSHGVALRGSATVAQRTVSDNVPGHAG